MGADEWVVLGCGVAVLLDVLLGAGEHVARPGVGVGGADHLVGDGVDDAFQEGVRDRVSDTRGLDLERSDHACERVGSFGGLVWLYGDCVDDRDPGDGGACGDHHEIRGFVVAVEPA